MCNRKRVISALEHQQPDKTPYHIEFTIRMHERMAAYYGDTGFDTKIGNAFSVLSTQLPTGWCEVEPDIWEDEFGVLWNREVDKDIGVVCNQRINPGNLDAVTFPNPSDLSRYAMYPQARASAPEQFMVASLGFSLFERAWTLCGMEDLLLAMVAEPHFVHRLLDRILEHNLIRIEHACSHDIDAMLFGDDWGSQHGLIMGPVLWREFIKPRVRAMYQAVRKHGKYVFIHSCGCVGELFPDLIECGVHCFNPFQPEVMDPFEMKQKYGDQLSFYGGISTQRTLPYAKSQEVRDQVRRLIDEVGYNGGFIAAPAHAVPPDARPENIAAMIDVLQSQ